MAVMSIAQYAQGLKRLFPKGLFWNRQQPASGSVLDAVLEAIAVEYQRLDARITALLEEADPRTVTELIDQWEGVAGLPDDCTGGLEALSDRRSALWSKLTEAGGQNAEFFEAVAARLGFTVTIADGLDPFSVGSFAGDYLYAAHLWRFVFIVTVSGRTQPAPALECVLRRLAPAHTAVIFKYEV